MRLQLQVALRNSPFIALASSTFAETSIFNGRPEFAVTPVATNPKGQPTLVYNCATDQFDFAALVRRNRSVENQSSLSILRPRPYLGRSQLQSCWLFLECTDFARVMSVEDIEDLIPQVGVQLTLLVDDMMTQLAWSDQ